MLSTDLTITCDQASHLLSAWLGAPTRCLSVVPLTGGMVNSVVRLSFDRSPGTAVLKASTSPDAGFERERAQLDYLRRTSRMRCPEAYRVSGPNEAVPYQALLMACVPGVPLSTARIDLIDRDALDDQLADILLELHAHRRNTYGDVDKGPGHETWAEVIVPRLVDMRAEVDGRLPVPVLRDIDDAIGAAPDAFAEPGPPTLIHGDLWAGNIMVIENEGHWQISGFVDPGLQYADVECELAYLQCFSTAGDRFFEHYTAQAPLRPGYERRRLYYWLNTMMIHVWLFGDSHYRQRTAAIAAQIVQAR